MASRQNWATLLRHTIRTENGPGWQLRGREIGGVEKTQVTYQFQDGLGKKNPRSSVFIPYDWSSRNQIKIITAVAELKRLLTEGNVTSLREAEDLRIGSDVESKTDNSENHKGWKFIADEFVKSRGNRKESTLTDLRTRLRRALETIGRSPKPRNWKELLTQYSKDHFAKCPEGGEGRKRQLVDVIAFLRFAVEEKGAPDRFLPPSSDSRKMKELKRLLIGKSQQKSLTVPLKGDQLEGLLESLKKNNKHSLYLAVGLVALYGLRPSELAVLEVRDSNLFVGHVKNNENSIGISKPPQKVQAIDLASLPGEGARLVALYESGKVQLPLAVRNAIKKAKETGEFKQVGQALRQLLKRDPYWKLLAKQNGLKVYSLRHSYAWRSHIESKNPYSLRATAALMRHDLKTHCKHYGGWMEDQELIAAGERFRAGQVKA